MGNNRFDSEEHYQKQHKVEFGEYANCDIKNVINALQDMIEDSEECLFNHNQSKLLYASGIRQYRVWEDRIKFAKKQLEILKSSE